MDCHAVPSASDLRRVAPGLARLLVLQQESRWLFQSDRGDGEDADIHPGVLETSLNPGRPRGYWTAGFGTLVLPPLVRDAFSNAWFVAARAMSQSSRGGVVSRCDEYPDGTLAVTVGEGATNSGRYRRALEIASSARSGDRLEEFIVNVLPRSNFPKDRMQFPVPGNYVTSHSVPIQERITLTAGDLRILVKLFGETLPWFDGTTARGEPFTGLFAQGGQLQFHGETGETSGRHKMPSDLDRRLALHRSKMEGRRWWSISRTLYVLAPPSLGRQLDAALAFIEENCTRQVAAIEIAAAAGLSISHLYAEFRRAMGCTPLDYAANRRLDIAERLLLETGLNVAEISERCGFAEQASLTRCFRRLRGTTPASIRRAARIPDKNS